VDTGTRSKLKYEGYCDKCKKVRFHRLEGGTISETRYRCMRCGYITKVKDNK
jgi:transposase-like protein